MLQLLYPCSRYSVDKCILCGGTFRDHLTLWWSKHLYTPYDRYLDQVYHESMTNAPSTMTSRDDSMKRKRNKADKSISSFDDGDGSNVAFGYHRRYVLDITTLLDNVPTPREKAKKLYRAIQQRYHPSTFSSHTGTSSMNINSVEQRTWPRFSKTSQIKYIIPRNSVAVQNNSNNKNHDGSAAGPAAGPATTRRPSHKSFILWLARDICLDAIDQLLNVQQRDRNKMVGTM